jgi:hypothetical protein
MLMEKNQGNWWKELMEEEIEKVKDSIREGRALRGKAMP